MSVIIRRISSLFLLFIYFRKRSIIKLLKLFKLVDKLKKKEIKSHNSSLINFIENFIIYQQRTDHFRLKKEENKKTKTSLLQRVSLA
jgi:hypothetical protein